MWRVIWEHGLSPLQMVGSLYSCLCISYHLSLSLSVSLLHALAWMQCLPMVGPLNDDCAFQSNLLTFKKRAASLLSCITITWLKKPEDRQRLPPPANLWTGIRAKSQLLFARFRLWTPGSWCLSRFKKAVSCPHAALKPEASVPFQLVPHHSVKLSFYMWGKGKSLSHVWLSATPCARLLCPWGFSRQEYWSGLPFPSPGDLPDPGIKLRPPTLQADSLPSEPPGKPYIWRALAKFPEEPRQETEWQGKSIILFSSVQFSRSVVSDSLRPHESQHARPPCLSPTPRVHSSSCPSSRWCHPAISSSVGPFSSCPQSLPASESFPMSQLFAWGGQSIGVSALASRDSQEFTTPLISEERGWYSTLRNKNLNAGQSSSYTEHRALLKVQVINSNAHRSHGDGDLGRTPTSWTVLNYFSSSSKKYKIIITYNGKESEKGNIYRYICINESLCCTSDTNRTLCTNLLFN